MSGVNESWMECGCLRAGDGGWLAFDWFCGDGLMRCVGLACRQQQHERTPGLTRCPP